MSKQDRTHSRTPADTENKFLLNLDKSFAELLGIATDARKTAEGTRSELSKSVAQIKKELTDKGAKIGLLVSDGKVRGEVLVEAINGQSSVKIGADKLDIIGKTLDIKVDATNVTGLFNVDGKIMADKINADGLDVEKGKVGDWILGEAEIPANAPDGVLDLTVKESALYSGVQTFEKDIGYYTVETWLTARGVYCVVKTYGVLDVLEDTNYYFKTWFELLTN